VEFIESELPGLDALIDQITEPIQNHDVRLALARYLARYQAGIRFETLVRSASPDIRELFADAVLPDAPHRVSDEAYEGAVHTGLPRLHRLYIDYFKRTGVRGILFPVTLVPALPIGSEADVTIAGRTVSFETAVAHNIAPGSTAGLPGLVLPAGLTPSGLPVALEIDAPAGHDRALLAIGSMIAAELGPLPAPPSPSPAVIRD
jgi:mandelamide amidase